MAHARTVHKLQGRSIDNLVISIWKKLGVCCVMKMQNFLNDIFLRKPLMKTRPMSEMCTKAFHEEFRATKRPKKERDDDSIFYHWPEWS